jgi:hypothetical protein
LIEDEGVRGVVEQFATLQKWFSIHDLAEFTDQ